MGSTELLPLGDFGVRRDVCPMFGGLAPLSPGHGFSGSAGGPLALTSVRVTHEGGGTVPRTPCIAERRQGSSVASVPFSLSYRQRLTGVLGNGNVFSQRARRVDLHLVKWGAHHSISERLFSSSVRIPSQDWF